MLEGVETPQSPAWWLRVLATQLSDRRAGREGNKRWRAGSLKPREVRPGFDLLDQHLRGDPPLPEGSEAWREAFRAVARMGRLNFAELVVEAKANRMELRDFRTAAQGDDLGDKVARALMTFNNLKVRAHEINTNALTFGRAYGMCIPIAPNEKYPRITEEDPREVITAHDPVTGQSIAALKLFRDDWDDADHAYLYIRNDEGGVDKYQARKPGRSSLGVGRFILSSKWEWVGDGPDPVPAGRMPIVRFRNRRDRGEFEDHLDTLDRINDQILNRLVISKTQAFRQMGLIGLPDTEEVTDENGDVVEEEVDYTGAFEMAPGSLWQLPEGVEVWESKVTDFASIRLSIKDDAEYLAAVTSTPLHIITPDAAAGSAEGASLLREEHVAAVGKCRDYMESGWVELIATAFAFMEDETRADVTQLQGIWGPIERYGLQEKATAASAAKGTLPLEQILTDIWQYPPAEVPAIMRKLAADQLIGALSAPPRPAPGQPAPAGLAPPAPDLGGGQ